MADGAQGQLSDNPHRNRLDVVGPKPADARAVVVLIHGRGSDGPSMIEMTTGITDDADVAWIAPTAANNTWYPDGFMAEWDGNQPWIDHTLNLFTKLLDRLNADGVSDERIVLMGFSQGAAVAAEMALRRPRPYGAVVVFTGGYIGPPGTSWDPPSGIEGVPVFIGTSDVDEWVPLARVEETAAVFSAAGANLDYRVFEGKGHDVSDEEKQAAGGLIHQVGAPDRQ